MQQTLTLIAAAAIALNAHAQPTLTFATNAPVVGTAHTLNYGNYVAPGSPGAMQTWDLTGLVSDSTDVLQLVAPSSTVNGAQFPTATIAEISSPVTTYYQVTPSGIHFAGSDDGTSIIINAPMGRYLPFPCTMGTNWSTPHASQFTYENEDVFRSGTVFGVVDGYGTLTMPWGTVQNVLRIHLTNLMQDSLSLFTLSYNYDSFLYYVAGQSYPIAELVTASVDFGLGSPIVDQFSRWTGALSTHVEAPLAAADNDLGVYPNPTRDVVNIMLPQHMQGNTNANILDAAGRVVRQATFMAVRGSTARMDLSGLLPGVYNVVLTDATGRSSVAQLLVQ